MLHIIYGLIKTIIIMLLLSIKKNDKYVVNVFNLLYNINLLCDVICRLICNLRQAILDWPRNYTS
jgi:hypothetical protein